MCPVPICCAGRPLALRLEWDKEMRRRNWPGTPLSLPWGTRNGIKTRSVAHQQHLSSHVHNILCYTKSTLKVRTPPPLSLYSISFPTSQPCMRWPSRHSNIGGPLSPSRPITFRCQSAVRGASGWQKQSVTKAECEKKTKKHCGVFIISELRSPVNEARVNCCWLDVSTHGWVSPQISLRGPQRETRERMRSLTDNDVESVSSVSPLWVWLRGRQIRNADGATQRCILSAETSNCSQNLGFQVTEKDCNHGDQII